MLYAYYTLHEHVCSHVRMYVEHVLQVYMARPRPTETDDSQATYTLTNDQWPLAW